MDGVGGRVALDGGSATRLRLQRRGAAERIGYVVLTPTAHQHELLGLLVDDDAPAVVAIGDRDPYYNQSIIDRLRAESGLRLLVVKNGGHLFEDVDRDIGRSVDNVRDVTVFVESAPGDGFFSVTI